MPDARLERTRAAYRDKALRNDIADAVGKRIDSHFVDTEPNARRLKTDAVYESIRDFDLWLRDKIATLRNRAKRGA